MNVYVVSLDEPFASPKLNDTLKLTMAMVANLFLVVALNAIWLLEVPVFGTRQLSFPALSLFDITTLALIAYYGLLIAADKLHALLVMLARAMRTGPVGGEHEDGCGLPPRTGLVAQITSNLWVPTTINFVIVTGLVYASGGIGYSPYFPVPLAMMAIGQCLYKAPPIQLGSGHPLRRILSFGLGVVRLYQYPLVMITSLLIALEQLQKLHPMVTRPAPTSEVVTTTLLSLFATMCVTFITRRADQAMGESMPIEAPERRRLFR